DVNVADNTKKSDDKPADEPAADGADSKAGKQSAGAEQTKAGTNDAEGKAKPNPGGSMFNREDILGGLPDRYKDQPGFIPDKSSEDLFHRPEGQTPRER